jgi:hypothetical protein
MTETISTLARAGWIHIGPARRPAQRRLESAAANSAAFARHRGGSPA